MKNTILAMVMSLGLATASVAYAQDYFDLYADPAMTQCSLIDNGSFTPVYVFLSGPAPATVVQFAAPRPACWQGATWVADGFPGSRGSFGNTQTGIQVTLFAPGFGECKTPPVFVCTMYFTTTGAAQPCCELVVVPPTSFPGEPYALEYIDCSIHQRPAFVGRKVVINPIATCACGEPLATEATTWGRVKSLYR